MSDARETLEDMLNQKHLLSTEREAIRSLLAELVEIKAYWEECQTEHHKRNLEVQNLKAEVERLRAKLAEYVDPESDIQYLHASEDEHFRRGREIRGLKARIEAALALHAWQGRLTTRGDVKLCEVCDVPLPCPTVKALKG